MRESVHELSEGRTRFAHRDCEIPGTRTSVVPEVGEVLLDRTFVRAPGSGLVDIFEMSRVRIARTSIFPGCRCPGDFSGDGMWKRFRMAAHPELTERLPVISGNRDSLCIDIVSEYRDLVQDQSEVIQVRLPDVIVVDTALLK